MAGKIRVQKQRHSSKRSVGQTVRPVRSAPVPRTSAVCVLAMVATALLQGPLQAASEGEQAKDQAATENRQESAEADREVVIYGYKIIRTYPHDPTAFTQGLTYENGELYEGTGLYGESVLTKRQLKDDAVLKRIRLPHKFFGEGITVLGEKVYQLTWKSRTGFTYNKKTFRPLDEFTFDCQGWGLTHDGTHLILSDGTATLRFIDPNTYAEVKRVTVYYNERPIRQLNELEFIDGQIYANVLPTYYIAIISPESGRVTAWIDLRGLYTPPPFSSSNDILNGIAYLPENKHLLVTGKRWPRMYEIELVPQSDSSP